MIQSINTLIPEFKDHHEFIHLPGYGEFLRNHKIDDWLNEGTALSRLLNLPLLKYFNSVPEEDLLKLSKPAAIQFFEAMANNRLYEYFQENMDLWKNGQLPLIEKDQLVAEDITIANYIRKKLLTKYIPEYTKDIEKTFSIIEEIDHFLHDSELAAFKLYISIQNEKIAKQILSIEDINQKLNQSTVLFNQAQALTHIGNWWWDISENVILWSDEMHRIYGLEPNEKPILFDDFISLVHPDDQHLVTENINHALTNLLFPDFYHRIILKNGQEKIIHAKGQVVTDHNGKVVQIVGTGQDITRQKKIENALIENQKFIQKIAQVSPLLIAVYNIRTGKYIFINDTIKQLLGYDADEATKGGVEFFMGIMHPDDLEPIMHKNNEALMRANSDQATEEERIVEFKYRMRHANGEYRWFHTYGSVFDRNKQGEVEHVINASFDITAENNLQIQLENEKVFAELLVESSPYMILSYDTDYIIKTWNKKTEEHTGIKKEDALGKSILALFPQYDNPTWRNETAKVFGGESLHYPKIQFLSEEGFGESFVIPLKNADQEVIGLLSITNNITEIVSAYNLIEQKNQELENAHFVLQAVLDGSVDIITALDMDLNMVAINKKALDFAGLKYEEVIGKHLLEILPDLINDPSYGYLQNALNGEFIHIPEYPSPINDRFLESYYTPLLIDNSNRGVLAVHRDITDIVNARNKIRKAQIELEEINLALQKSENQYHKMVSEVQDYAILLLDKHGNIENWNKGAEKIKGYKSEEIIGKHFRIFYTPKDQKAKVPEHLLQSASLNGKVEHEGWRQRKDGTLFWGTVAITALYSETGELIGFSKVSRDLTERKKSEDEIKDYASKLESKNKELSSAMEKLELAREQLADDRTRLLVNAMPQIVALVNMKGELEYTNDMLSDYTGVDFRDLNQADWPTFIHPEDMNDLSVSLQKSIASGNVFQGEFRLRRADGNFLWHTAIVKPIPSITGQINRWVISINNIHIQKLTDAKKDEFMGIASHELKTPLTSIKAYIQLLSDSITLKKIDESKFLVEKANKSINRLNDLITELLDMTGIQHGRLNFNISDFDFIEMLNETIELIQASARHQIRKQTPEKLIIAGDRDRLQQVVINLISNAIKYSPAADTVHVEAYFENGSVVVKVVDHGIGISKSDVDKIFTRFYRVEGNAHQFQGLGIGLFIASEIISRHNGKIWVESDPGKGSVFYFRIPINLKE